MIFEKHIFISYAHLDNQPLDESEPGWVSYFHQKLEVRLSQLMGRAALIWRDEELRGNHAFSDVILAELDKVALLVTVLSPRYLESEWCRREFETFCEEAAEKLGLKLEHHYRVFKVVKTPVPLSRQFPLLQEVTGYDFFRSGTDGRFRELNPAFGRELKFQFIQQVDDLAQDLSSCLGVLSVGEVSPPEGPVIYLAEVDSETQSLRNQVRRELQQHGYRVLPGGSLPPTVACRELAQESLSEAVLSLHLVGRSPGFTPEGEKRSLVQLQFDLASEKQSQDEGFQRLVWTPPGLSASQVDNADHSEFLASLRTDPEFLQVPLEELKEIVLERLAEPVEEIPAPTDEEGVPNVYVLFHNADLEEVMPVTDTLFEAGLELLLPAMEGSPSERIETHKRNLCECDAAIIVHGGAPDAWMQKVWSDVRQATGFGRAQAIPAKMIYQLQPLSAFKKLFRTREATVVKSEGSVEAEHFREFIKEAKK